MTAILKPLSKDDSHIGEIAAQQPLSGVRIVTNARVKGVNATTFVRITNDSKKPA